MEQQSAAALEGGIASATPALIFQPTSAPAPRDSQLDSALLQARRSLTPDESLFVKLDKALQRECPHARDLVLGLLSKEVDAAYIRVADNIKRFKALLEEYADLNNSEEMWALRRLLPELNSSDIHTLEQLSQTIHKHADRITTCIESEDYGSLKQFAQLVLKNAKKFQDKYASIQPRLKELSEKFKELEARLLWGAELRHHERAEQAFMKMEEVLHDLSGRLDGAADHLSRLLEATQTVRDTAEDMAREAEDGEDLKDPGGQVASDAQSEINAVLAQLAVDLQERATDLSKRVGESREPFSRLERRSGHEALLPPPRS